MTRWQLSENTEVVDRGEKMPIYARAGAAHAWLVDPRAHALEVFRRESARWRLVATLRAAAVARIEPFDAVERGLSLLWTR